MNTVTEPPSPTLVEPPAEQLLREPGCPPVDSDWARRRSLLGPWIASLWLAFLVPALVDGWRLRHEAQGIVGMAATVAFMVLYILNWFGARRSRMRLLTQPPLRYALAYVAALLALGVLMVALLGPNATSVAVFIAVAAIMTLPLKVAVPLEIVLVVATIVVGHERGWPGQVGVAFGTVLGSLAVFGMRTVMARNLQLWRAHEENTLLAVDNERNRFARDLHDILGHSLTVITVKAELAQRLVEADPERAKAEIADLERLSRDALADVRRAVEGYRELTLPGELARARVALRAAEIEPALPQSTDVVPTELRELFAWTVREGVTNVIRHSGASHCEIVLTGSGAVVRDDGTGPGACPEGSGLTGLRERAAAVGARVTIRPLEPGFALEVLA